MVSWAISTGKGQGAVILDPTRACLKALDIDFDTKCRDLKEGDTDAIKDDEVRKSRGTLCWLAGYCVCKEPGLFYRSFRT